MKSITRWVTLAALFLVPIFPVIVADQYYFPFITGKAFYFRILVEIAFAGWVLLAFLDAKYRPRLNGLTIAVTVFALITLVADLLGVSPLRSISSNFERMEGWITIAHLWMFFMAITHTFGKGEEGRDMWHRWFIVSLVIATYVAGRGALQWAGKLQIAQSASRPDSTLGNAAYLAVYMLMHGFIAIYQFFTAHERRKSDDYILHWTYAVLALFFFAILYSTATRGAIIGLISAALLSLTIYAVFAKKEASTSRLISVALIGLIVLTGVTLWINRDKPFIQNNEVLRRMTSISVEQFKGEGRSFVWPMALKGWTQRPILGWGQENFNYIFNANYHPKMWGQEQWFDRAHSVFLDWLVASGIVGFISYLSLYIILLWIIWKSHVSLAAKSALTGLVVGYAVHNIFVFDNLASYVCFFALLGLGASLSAGKEIAAEKSLSKDAIEYIVAPIVIVLLVIAGYFVNVATIQANRGLIAALRSCQSQKPDAASFTSVLKINSAVANQEIREQILSCAGAILPGQYPNTTKMAYFNLANQALQDQVAASPRDARIYTLGGSFLMTIGQAEAALPILEKAHALSPAKQSIDFDLATAYINLNQSDKALALLKAAYDSAPEYLQSRLAYTGALILAGKEAQAKSLFGNDMEVFQSPTVAQVYISAKQYDKGIAIFEKRAATASTSVDARLQLVQAQYMAKRKEDAIATLRTLAKDFPEYAEDVNKSIKQIQAEK